MDYMKSPMPIVKIKKITQSKCNIMLERLAQKIKNSKEKFDYIMGIENGGVNVSIPLGLSLKLPHKTIKISFYGDDKKPSETPIVDLRGHIFKEIDKVLLVDDLTDSGKTLEYFKNNFKCDHKVAVLFHNERFSTVIPEYYSEIKPYDKWIIFPWERNK